jgi:integrase
MPLTDTAIRKTKPTDKPQKMFDGGGLYLLLNPNGSRWWRWKHRVGGKEKLLSFGVYPDVSLAQAREKRDEARKQLAAGIDPGANRKAVAAAAKPTERVLESFEVVAREWLAGRPWVDSYKKKVVAWFVNDVFPCIGARPLAELEAPDFLAVARRMEERDARESAHRVMQNCGQVMRYAIATGRARRDPVADLKGALLPSEERNHAAVTEARALGPLLRAMQDYSGTVPVQIALRLAPLVFVRPVELRTMEWTELDLDAGTWLIPKGKMKRRTEHLVPLARQAVELLREIHPLSGDGRFVFPGHRDRKRPMSENAVLAALRRMGFTKDEVTGHGFRATARTMLDQERGFRPDIIEHQLAHRVKDPNGRAYNRTTHLPERIRMMQAWADYLDELRLGAGG